MKQLSITFFLAIGVIAISPRSDAFVTDDTTDVQIARNHQQAHVILVNGGFDVLDKIYEGLMVVKKLQGQMNPKVYTVFIKFMTEHMTKIDTITSIIKKNPTDLDEILRQMSELFKAGDMKHYIKELVRDFPQGFDQNLRLLLLKTFVSVKVSVVSVAAKCLSVFGLERKPLIVFVKNALTGAGDNVATVIVGPLGRAGGLFGNVVTTLLPAILNTAGGTGLGLDLRSFTAGIGLGDGLGGLGDFRDAGDD